MNRALILGGAGLVGVATAAAAIWAPGVLRPAGARAELARLIARSLDVGEATVPDDAPEDAAQLAAQDEEGIPIVAPVAAFVPLPSARSPVEPLPAPPGHGCTELSQFSFHTAGDAGARIEVVVCRAGEKRAESSWMRREALKKS